MLTPTARGCATRLWDESLYPLSDHALHRTLQTPPFQPLQAAKPASRFHALVLLGVAAAFRAAVSAQPTKPTVASELAEAKHPAAFPHRVGWTLDF